MKTRTAKAMSLKGKIKNIASETILAEKIETILSSANSPKYGKRGT